MDILKADQPVPAATFAGQRVLVQQHKGWWQAVIGIGLDTRPGLYQLSINHGQRSASFSVFNKDFTTQILTIEDTRKVNPTAEDQIRINAESSRIRLAREAWRDAPAAVPGTFLVPVKGRISSSFGVRRVLNGQLRNPHSGMDIAAETGTAVVAPAAAIVVDTGDFFYTGNTVLLDHGQGLVTLYAHLHSIDVEPGDSVAGGQQLGTVGATGRVTGPHLHWSAGLNGQWIDPGLLLNRQMLAQ